MLSIDDFKPVTIKDKFLFDLHYKKYPPIHSDNVFTTIISWKEYANYHFTFVNNNLIIMTKMNNTLQFRPPIGKFDKNLFQELLKIAKKECGKYPLELIDNKVKKWILKYYPKFELFPNREYFDYIYLASDLAELPGSAYRKIRNRYNKFKRNNLYESKKITEENMEDVKKFLKRWCLWKDCDSDPLLANEKKAIMYSIKNFFELKLSGLAILIDEKIEAIAVYEKMSNDMVVIHYEKGSPYHDGIYKAINVETAKLVKNVFKYINREADMGLPGLRKAKMSYRPHHMVEVYHISKDNIILY